MSSIMLTAYDIGAQANVIGRQFAQATSSDSASKDNTKKSTNIDEAEKKKANPLTESSQSKSWQQLVAADYLGLPDVDREVYVIGLSDAYNWSYAGGFKKMRWIVDCTENKYGGELTVIFEQWLHENPDRWEEPAAKLFAFAIFDHCDFGGTSK